MVTAGKIQIAITCICLAVSGCATTSAIRDSTSEDLLKAREGQFSILDWASTLDRACPFLGAEDRTFVDDQIRQRRAWLEARNSKLLERQAQDESAAGDEILRSIVENGCQEAAIRTAERSVKAARMAIPPQLAGFDESLAEGILWSAALNGVAPIWEAAGSEDGGIYRFSWGRSFHPYVVITVIVHSDGTANATTKVEGLDWESNTIIDKNHIRNLDPEQTAKLVNLHDNRFWKALPVAEEASECSFSFLDGASWSFEAYDSGHYQFASRDNPDYRGQCAPKDNSFFYSLGLSFIEASGVQFDAIY